MNAHYTSAEVVQAMWHLAGELGFEGGRVLEPGCGSGNFVGFGPPGAEMVGVELDPTTAEVARLLYGDRATIQTGRFEELRASDGEFDLVIGNVPFADVRPYDPRHNAKRHTLHNYFLVKSLRLTRPGGLVVALTSRYTLDARARSARDDMADMADLVGAVRLPERAFAKSSGTDVVVDLVVLRRRTPGAAARGPAWASTAPWAADGAEGDAAAPEPLAVNEYFVAHPEMVLGEVTTTRGMYRADELTVLPDGPLADRLTEATRHLASAACAHDLTYAPRTVSTSPAAAATATARAAAGPRPGPAVWDLAYALEGSFVTGDNRLGRYVDGRVEPYTPRFDKDVPELRRLVGIRDAARHVLAVQLGNAANAELASAQAALRSAYDNYVRLYGPVNRSTTARTGRSDRATGEEVTRRVRPRMGGFRDDPDWALVSALEVFDEETQHARPAAIFTTRVVSPPPERDRVETPAEAVAVCLDETGSVTAERVGELLDCTPDEARKRLDGLVFEDPSTGILEPAGRYLSGNVRHKLAAARTAAEADPRWQLNVEALDSAMPRQLEPAEITARFGAAWIAPGDIEDFCWDVLEVEVQVEHLAEVGQWATKLVSGYRGSVAMSSQWGTARADALAIVDASLNQRLVTVSDQLDSGKRVRNVTETLAARDKQEALADRFSAWVWEQPDRAARLAGRYNELFCSHVVPAHDGSHLTLPGLSDTFTPRQHQRDAVARVLTDGRALLAHAVGAGKTATMVMAAMELRRLGSASKPAIVVPNHMLEQFTREWLQLYPTARVLVADKDRLTKERRKEFVARCATGDWDGVIFTQSGFERIPLGKDLWSAYLADELADARAAALAASQEGKRISVKRLERRVEQMEAKYQELLKVEAKDDGVRWEETGIDYLFVDEAHLYKNRQVVTQIDGVATAGSQRAQQLDAKLWALRRHHGPRVVTLATATPVANGMSELWVMESYLHPDVLGDLGLAKFDAWAATFGRTHTALELAPDGSSYRMQTRFARFQNVPELLGVYRQVADVRTAADLDLPVPDLAGGRPETVVVPSSPALDAYVKSLVDRAEAVRNRSVEQDEDNMLKVVGDGRRAALDLRLVGEPPDPEGGKVAHVARRVAAIHHANSSTRFLDQHGEPADRPGALQLVFCDVSTPASDGWNAYGELRDQLARRGVPREAIRFMQDARTDQAKAALFAACRDGTVAVLVGSTETMGVGTNVQARAVALHHLDAPWRPADIEQRDGRILRQGNQNRSVEVIRYVTEGSFDTYMWQTLERKAAFIAQVSRGDAPDREIDDIGEQSLSFAEVKALATGDPLILEKAGVDAEVAKLTRLERSYHADQRQLRSTADNATWRATQVRSQADELQALTDRAVDTTGDRFHMTVDGQAHAKRTEAGAHLKSLLASRLAEAEPDSIPDREPIGELAGFTVTARPMTRIGRDIQLGIPDIGYSRREPGDALAEADPVGLIRGMEHAIQGLPQAAARRLADAGEYEDQAAKATAMLGRPWEHADRYAKLRRRQQELDDALTATASDVDVPAAPPPTGPSAPPRVRPALKEPRPPAPSPSPAGLSM